ncbi:TPA: penicillin-binding protein 2, partial [Streptococcus suis]|nr:penicillin-binding protein 2 [Streptococcus suis]
MKKRKNKPLEHDGNFISLRLNILFSIVIFLFLVLILRLADMQIVNQDFYSNKLSTASQKIISTGSVRGQIFDAKGKPLVENQIQQVVSFTRSNKMTAQEMKEVARKLLQWVSVSNVSISRRDKADYYLADTEVYKKVVAALPDDKRYDSDGNYLEESKIYSNAVDSLSDNLLQYSEEESKAIELFKQMNGATYFSTVNLVTDPLSAEQVAHI